MAPLTKHRKIKNPSGINIFLAKSSIRLLKRKESTWERIYHLTLQPQLAKLKRNLYILKCRDLGVFACSPCEYWQNASVEMLACTQKKNQTILHVNICANINYCNIIILINYICFSVPPTLIITVFAVPCSPISKTAFPCLMIVCIRKSVRTLSMLGTRMEVYSGTESLG